MNWGHGLAMTMAAFMIFILSFVYKSVQQDFSLVSKNYYEESLEHDAVQLKRGNYKALNESLRLNLEQSPKILKVSLPTYFNDKSVEGKVFLYNPIDHKKDKAFELKDNSIEIPLEGLTSGLWKVKVDWNTDGKSYLFEKSQFIN